MMMKFFFSTPFTVFILFYSLVSSSFTAAVGAKEKQDDGARMRRKREGVDPPHGDNTSHERAGIMHHLEMNKRSLLDHLDSDSPRPSDSMLGEQHVSDTTPHTTILDPSTSTPGRKKASTLSSSSSSSTSNAAAVPYLKRKYKNSSPHPARRLQESLGTPYFRQVGGDILDNANFEHGTSVSISDNGDIVAVSGMVGGLDAENQDIYMYTVSVYKDVDGVWTQVGQALTEADSTGTAFSSDARADVSLNGNGSKLAIGNTKAERGDGTSVGLIKIYSHSLADIQVSWTSEGDVDCDVGGGGVDVGLKVSLDADGSRLAVGIPYYDQLTSGEVDSGTVVIYSLDTTPIPIAQMNGTTSGDYAGSSVMISRDGECVVFGATGDDTSIGTNSGSASIYCAGTNGAWLLRAVLNGEDTDNNFGFSVAINSDAKYIAVGSKLNDPNNSTLVDAGHVRVFRYKKNSNTYTQLGADIDGARGEKSSGGDYYVGDQSGFSIALSDLNEELGGIVRVAIGSPYNNGDNGYYNGHVRLFQCNPKDSTPSWTQVLDDINGETVGESSGYSISMSKDGRRIVVGSPNSNPIAGGNFNGVAKVYEQTEYTALPSMEPSVSPSTSNVPSQNPSASLEREFEIRSFFGEFDQARKWCITAETQGIGSRIIVRPCDEQTRNLQVWKRDELGQLKLAFVSDGLCIKSVSRKISLESCSSAEPIAEALTFEVMDETGEIKQTKNNKIFLVGFDDERRFSRLSLFQDGSFNKSLDKWKVRYEFETSLSPSVSASPSSSPQPSYFPSLDQYSLSYSYLYSY